MRVVDRMVTDSTRPSTPSTPSVFGASRAVRSNNLALTLTSLGRHDEAVPLLRMTLDARELQNGLQTTEWITVARPGATHWAV